MYKVPRIHSEKPSTMEAVVYTLWNYEMLEFAFGILVVTQYLPTFRTMSRIRQRPTPVTGRRLWQTFQAPTAISVVISRTSQSLRTSTFADLGLALQVCIVIRTRVPGHARTLLLRTILRLRPQFGNGRAGESTLLREEIDANLIVGMGDLFRRNKVLYARLATTRSM